MAANIRFATEADIPVILEFIHALAAYENMEDQVIVTPELLKEWVFQKKKAEVFLVSEDEKPVGFALFFHNFSTWLGRAGIYLEDLFVLPGYFRNFTKNRGKCRMKKILFIATGGTIASAKTENGLTPAITSEELLNAVPQVKNLCAVDTVQPYSLDSTNMCWKQWIHVAEIIRDSYAKYDGFVIAHGTDTLSYAAATLSYLIQKNEKPVVLTGAQKSIEVPDGDARRNLFGAFVYATDARACGTHVVFNGHVIAGTRARKTHTKSFDAFSSIDFPDIGVFYDKKLLCYIDERPECPGAVFYDKLVPEILSIRVIPGMDPSVFDYITAHCRGVVIESFGVGGIPYYGDNAFEEKIAALMENGVRVVITTQVPHEGSNLSVYRVGHIIKEKYRVLEASNMTTEAVIAKMMWALAYSETREEFEKLFCTPVGKDQL